MDVEKTMQFILDHQAKFEAGLEELRQAQKKTELGLDRLEVIVKSSVQALSLDLQRHRERRYLDGAVQKAHEGQFQALLDRFDFLRG